MLNVLAQKSLFSVWSSSYVTQQKCCQWEAASFTYCMCVECEICLKTDFVVKGLVSLCFKTT